MSLTTNYLGLVLKNPIVASSSPLLHSVDSIRLLEDAGASAVVMYSLFTSTRKVVIGCYSAAIQKRRRYCCSTRKRQ
jgi:dihydroorotate dehydrogenase